MSIGISPHKDENSKSLDKILITGGTGLLALNWYMAAREDYEVTLGIHRRQLGLRGVMSLALNLSSVDDLVRCFELKSPTFVVHAAGCTSVEQCESHSETAYRTNVGLSANVARACRLAGIQLVHISTDHLFDGKKAMVSENEELSPLKVYAKTKADAEDFVREIDPTALIIRTNFFGWGTRYRRSFSDVIIDALRGNRSISLFDDVHYTPILVERVVTIVHSLVKKRAKGVFNVVGSERLSKFEFGLRVADVFGLNKDLIERGAIARMPELVRRPKDMSLSCEKVVDALNEEVGSVDEHLRRLNEQEINGHAKELANL